MSWWGKVVSFWTNTEEVKVRARTEEGKFVADDKSTPDVNEAWVGGKAPKSTYKKPKQKKTKVTRVKKK